MNKELIDNLFYIVEQKWGTWNSYDKYDNPIITSFTKNSCIYATKWYLKEKQESKIKK